MKLVDIARVVRSKNAGPTTLTLDLMFNDEVGYVQAQRSPALTPAALAKMYGERISRIEAEMTEAVQVHASSSLQADTSVTESLRLKSDSVVNYPQRAMHG